jgi:hypothetical protein
MVRPSKLNVDDAKTANRLIACESIGADDPTEWTAVDFHTHGYEIVPLSGIESNIARDHGIGEIISGDDIVVFTSCKVLNG